MYIYILYYLYITYKIYNYKSILLTKNNTQQSITKMMI